MTWVRLIAHRLDYVEVAVLSRLCRLYFDEPREHAMIAKLRDVSSVRTEAR